MSVVEVTGKNFENEVLDAKGTVLVDFWAPWCGPCKMLSPIIDEIGEEGNVKVCKINVDEERELAMKYEVMSIPTVMVVKDSQVTNKSVGFVPKDKILEMIRG